MFYQVLFFILAVLPVAYVLIGYAPERVLKTQQGFLFAVGIGDNILFFIDGDHVPWFLSYIPLPPPFKQIWIRMQWWEVVEGESKKTAKITNRDTATEEPKYKDMVVFPTDQNTFMGLRNEKVPSIRKLEPVGYDLEVISKDGYTVYLLVTFIFRIHWPMDVIKIPNFKMIGKMETLNKMKIWAQTKELEEIHIADIAMIADPDNGILVKNSDGIYVDLETYLDDEHFFPLGFEIEKKGWKIVNSKEGKEYFTLKNEARKYAQQQANALAYGILREAELKIEKADADQQNKIMEDAAKNLRLGIKDLIKDIYAGKTKVAAANPYLLVKVEHEADELGETLIKEFLNKLSIVGDTTSSKHFKKEEVADVTSN